MEDPQSDGERGAGRASAEELARRLAPLAGVALGHDDLSSALREVARVATSLVPGADGVSIMTFHDGAPTAVASTDEWVKELDELQFAEREGPCLDATRTGNTFRVRDFAADTRWPAYAEHAVKHGASSIVSIPLAAEGRTFGAMNVYARDTDAFTSEDVALAEIIALHAGMASQVAATFFRHRELATQMREAMQSRALIEQAKGVLMAQRKISDDAAFDLLSGESQRSNRKLRLVAQHVVETGSLSSDG